MKKQAVSESYEQGVLWMLLSALFLSVSFLFLKISLDYVDYFFLLFLRFFCPLLMILLIVMMRNEWRSLVTSARIPLQISRAACVLVAQYGIAYYITQNTLLNATVLLNASPLFIPLIEWIFLKRRPGKSTIIGALIAFFGVLLVLHPDRSILTPISGIGLLAALGQAGSQVLYGLQSKKESVQSSLFYLFFFTSLAAILIFLFTGDFEIMNTQGLKVSEWAILLTVLAMAAGTLLNQYFRGLAYRHGNPSTLATFLYFSVVVSFLFDWLIFHKIPGSLSIIGACLVILGGVVKIILRAHILKKRNKN